MRALTHTHTHSPMLTTTPLTVAWGKTKYYWWVISTSALLIVTTGHKYISAVDCIVSWPCITVICGWLFDVLRVAAWVSANRCCCCCRCWVVAGFFNDLDSMWPAKATAAAEQLMADIGDIGTLSADCGRWKRVSSSGGGPHCRGAVPAAIIL